jgi:hypothetical protein
MFFLYRSMNGFFLRLFFKKFVICLFRTKKIIMPKNFILAYCILAKNYLKFHDIKPYELRMKKSKRETIKTILNNCSCNKCINTAYFIDTLDFFI